MPECCANHLNACWYDPCCDDCPSDLCAARRRDTGQRCTLKPHGDSADLAAHVWSERNRGTT